MPYLILNILLGVDMKTPEQVTFRVANKEADLAIKTLEEYEVLK